MKLVILLSFVLASWYLEIEALSCFPCNAYPCNSPRCCSSGYLTLDTCGCCQTCAKGDGDACGGPWGTSGKCGAGLSCLRTCHCEAVNNKTCVFPFTHNDKEYFQCTTDGSDDGLARCATQVDEKGNAVDGEWVQCNNYCPGVVPENETNAITCGSTDLFNAGGKCVSLEVRTRLEGLNISEGFQFDDGIGSVEDNANYTIDICPTSNDPPAATCRCTKDIPNGELGHCEKIKPGWNPSDQNGWCWLEFVDMTSPNDCYHDVEWSISSGRYYSYAACNAENEGAIFDPPTEEPLEPVSVTDAATETATETVTETTTTA